MRKRILSRYWVESVPEKGEIVSLFVGLFFSSREVLDAFCPVISVPAVGECIIQNRLHFLIVISDGEIRQEQIMLEQVSIRNVDSLLLAGHLFVTFLWIWQMISEIEGERYGEGNFGTWIYKTPRRNNKRSGL